MTREEALNVLIIKAGKGDFVKDIINQIYDEHEAQLKAKDERIRELEETQLNRREWYQKGYKEAMNHKKCGGCKHYEEKQCTNENSIAFGGINAVYKDDFCNDFEPKDNA